VNRFTKACLQPSQIGLDPFMGSGTSLVSFVASGGFGVGYETQPKYVALAQKTIAGPHQEICLKTSRLDPIIKK